ncbi:uncharacterized protein [Brachyistius frenatus]|uniref:uncharacterized protein n=1 Tax=Brachyistius frenatus TaxID=100188 RepID=UPI0037E8AFC7
MCHCNSHNRNQFWSNLRNQAVLGVLTSFKLTLSEVDSHLQHAKTMLQNFRRELSALFSSFIKGQTPQELGLTQQGRQALIHNYTPVFEFVSSFLSKAEEQDSRAAAIMNLGAAEDFIGHFQFSGSVMVLLQRVTALVQKQMVMASFTPEFSRKLQDFYQRLHIPSEMKCMRNSLCVRPWDDVLLVSVLKGQNVSGVRKDRGRKDILFEQMSVVLLRTELLQHQCRYRELCRYLRVVQTDNPSWLKQVQELVPFFTCMEGQFTSALSSLFASVSAPASCFTPHLFLCYLRIFRTATAPKLTVSQPTQLCCSDAAWEAIQGAVPLKRVELVKFALRAHMCCAAVYIDPQCWTSLLSIVNITALPEPDSRFLLEARDVVNSILQGSNMNIPRLFLDVYPNQALLLLVTGALRLRILHAGLTPAIPVLNTFKDNVWAFKWLCDNLSSNEERFKSFFQEIAPEMENTGLILCCIYSYLHLKQLHRSPEALVPALWRDADFTDLVVMMHKHVPVAFQYLINFILKWGIFFFFFSFLINALYVSCCPEMLLRMYLYYKCS